MKSSALLILGIFCFAFPAVLGEEGEEIMQAGLYDQCQDCVMTVEKMYELQRELTKEGINFFNLPVPCGLIEDDSEICDRLLEEVVELPGCEVCDAYKICARINYCYGSSHLPVSPTTPVIYEKHTNKSINIDILADSFCYGCKRIMKRIRADTKNMDKTKISSMLKTECRNFKGILSVYCSTLVDQQLSSLVSMLVERRPQATICEGLEQCSFPYCEACYNFVTEYKKDPHTSTVNPCSQLKPVMSSFCTASLDYSKNVFSVLVHRPHLKSYRVCYTLAYCPRREHDMNLLQGDFF